MNVGTCTVEGIIEIFWTMLRHSHQTRLASRTLALSVFHFLARSAQRGTTRPPMRHGVVLFNPFQCLPLCAVHHLDIATSSATGAWGGGPCMSWYILADESVGMLPQVRQAHV
jgi:hypothetical protein